MYLKARQK